MFEFRGFIKSNSFVVEGFTEILFGCRRRRAEQTHDDKYVLIVYDMIEKIRLDKRI